MPSAAGSCRPRASEGARWTAERSRAGFTLLEVLITLILLALTYAIVIPSIGRARVQAAVYNSTQAVISTISLAKAAAVRFGRPSVLRIDSDRDRMWVEVDTTVGGSGAADTLGFFSFADQLEVDLESDRTTLCFDGRGIGVTRSICPEAGAAIIVSLQGKADTVFVSRVGRVLTR
jgi:prepilin-type N-terminal cleavage/methylation domain-containing protein